MLSIGAACISCVILLLLFSPILHLNFDLSAASWVLSEASLGLFLCAGGMQFCKCSRVTSLFAPENIIPSSVKNCGNISVSHRVSFPFIRFFSTCDCIQCYIHFVCFLLIFIRSLVICLFVYHSVNIFSISFSVSWLLPCTLQLFSGLSKDCFLTNTFLCNFQKLQFKLMIAFAALCAV